MNYFKLLILLFVTASPSLLNGQVDDYNIRYFTTQDGLSSDIVRTIFQDKQGFIWIGTKSGLNRFDGHSFKVFTKRKNGLPNNEIGGIWEDLHGKLWLNFNAKQFNNSSLLSIFDTESEQSYFFEDYFPNAPFGREDIQKINSDEHNNIWIITKEGAVYRYRDNFELIAKNKLFGEAVDIKVYHENDIWIGAGNFLIKINNQGDELRTIKIASKATSSYGKLANQKIWVQQNLDQIILPKIDIFDKEGNISSYKTTFESKASPNWIKSICITDKNGNAKFWHIGTETFFSTDVNGKNILDFSPRREFDFTGLYINDLILDKFDNIWVASSRGVILISPKSNLFRTYLMNENPFLEKISTRDLEEINEQEILVATYVGFFLVNKITGDTTHLSTVKGIKNRMSHGLKMTTIGDKIFCGKHGLNFWLIDKKTLKFEFILCSNLNGGELHSFYQDKFKQIWICNEVGILWLDLKNKQALLPPNANKKSDLYQTRVNHFFENNNEILISTEKGLFAIDHQGAIIEDFEDLSNYQINFLHQASDDIYWLATKGNGLLLWNRKTNSIRRFSKEQGLSDDYIYSILEDEFGFYWLPSNNGLMRFNPKDFSINIFNEIDGIAHKEFNTHSSLQAKDGQIYLGGVNGITSFHPKDFQFLEETNVPLKITSIKKLKTGEVEFKDAGKNPQGINFNASDKAIAIDFCLFDYRNSFQSKYAYKIDGYENEWNYLKENRLVINNRLPYGNYKLKVKAQGSHGSWSNHVLELPLNVLRPFYLTWQFILLSILILLGVIYGIFRWRIIRLEKRNLVLENIVTERTKELADLNKTKDQFFAIIAHDMRGLVLSFKNISQKVGFLQRKGRQDEVNSFLQSVDKSAESLSNLLDNLLNWALVEKGVFPHHPELFNLEKVVLENVKLFTQLSRIKEIELSYEVPETLNLFADKNAFSTIIRNLINNAIKFSSAGDQVIIEAAQKNDQIQIQIKDTGVGIASAKLKNIFELDSKKTKQGTIGEKGTGLGLLLCKELTKLNNGEIHINSEEGKGTQVVIDFPLVA